MSLYTPGRKVYHKGLGEEGEILDAWMDKDMWGNRFATYLVLLDTPTYTNAGWEVRALSNQLRPIDGHCDGCGKPRKASQLHSMQVRLSNGDVDDVLWYCFLCYKGIT